MADTKQIADAICRAVAELPDRNSPEGWPEAMLVTHGELAAIVTEALASTPTQPASIQAGNYPQLPNLTYTYRPTGKDRIQLFTTAQMHAYVDADRAAHRVAQTVTTALADSLSETVLIEGIKYEVPAPVACELLRLHLNVKNIANLQDAGEAVLQATQELTKAINAFDL